MDEYSELDPETKIRHLNQWFLTALATAATPSACDPETATLLSTDSCQPRPIAEYLNVIDQDYFDDDFLSEVQHQSIDTNHRLKTLNLQRVVRTLLSYFKDVQNKSFTPEFLANYLLLPKHVKEIVENPEEIQLRCMLLQLVLGVAVNNMDQVNIIMNLPVEDQAVVAGSIGNLQSGQIDFDPNLPNWENSDSDSEVLSAKTSPRAQDTADSSHLTINEDEANQKLHELSRQLNDVNEHKHQIEAENEQLKERLRALSNNEFFQEESEQFQQKLSYLKEQIDEQREESYKLEVMKDEYKTKLEMLQNEYDELHESNKEKDMQLEDFALMQDEIEYLRQDAARAASLEAGLEQTKRKLIDYAGIF